MANTHDMGFLQHLVVCPVCKAKLDFSPDLIKCTLCNLQFHQSQKDCFDLLPCHLPENNGGLWEKRQQEMEDWYRNLIVNPTNAYHCFVNDYTPYAPLLATLSGLILDLGGGNGIVRHFLPNNVQYIIIDPSLDWLRIEWLSIADRFPCLKTKPYFVRGVGEYLPFPAHSFDVVLSFWSLNHANHPERVFREVYQVLRSGGRFFVILEDMEPRWVDIIKPTFLGKGVSYAVSIFTQKLRHAISKEKWPLQNDHISIQESDIQKWISQGFEVVKRAWIGQYLTFEFLRV